MQVREKLHIYPECYFQTILIHLKYILKLAECKNKLNKKNRQEISS